MRPFLSIGKYGKKSIVSHHGKCAACRKPAVLSSYVSTRFLDLFSLSLFPLGSIYVVDACPLCGFKTVITDKKHRKQRKKDVAKMMKGFSKKTDDPDAILNALHTLMVYNEETWFLNVKTSYGMQFETHMQVQYVIAQGLCRFGKYAEAITYCHTAMALGAGEKATELLNLCQTLKERDENHPVDESRIKPESAFRRYTFLIASSIASVLALAILGAILSFSHSAWLVNGTPIQYSVKIDGRRYKLEQYDRRRILVHLGNHEIKTEGPLGFSAPVSFKYSTSLLHQFTDHHELVLNPDTMAMLISETTDGHQATNQYLYGNTVNALTNVQYAFSDFPNKMPTDLTTATRIYQHLPETHLEAMDYLRTHADETDAIQYARKILELKPNSSETSALLAEVVKTCTLKEAYELIQPGLEFLPPLMDWHVFHQNYAAKHDPDKDLRTEYALLCERYPDVPEYYYLLGRVVEEMDQAHLLFEKAEDGPGCNGLGYYAIARDLLCSGRFNEALPYSEKALDQDPDQSEFEQLNARTLLACKKYTQLLQLVYKNMANDPGNGERVAEEIKYLTLMGKQQAAQDAISRFPDTEGIWKPYFSAIRFYATGSINNYLGASTNAERPEVELQQLLHEGKIQEAYQIVQKDPQSKYTDFLLLYSAALYHDLPSEAKAALTKTVMILDETDEVQRAIKKIILSRRKPMTKELLDLQVWPEEKAILCTALGFRFPFYNETFFRMAAIFNYTPEYPQLLLKKWTTPSENKL